MKKTGTLIIGASISGLASASALEKQQLEYIIIEKQVQVAAPWRTHYDRLHLHTNKRVSNLPYKKFSKTIPRYPSRQQVIDYLEDYQREFNINPVFNTEATSIRKESDYWITTTPAETFLSKYVIIATGVFGKPRPINFKRVETFTGRIMHSCDYKNGREFKDQRVLVVGFGNSACEIAMDLYEHSAIPSMAVRSPVNIVPRDIFGIPILEISLLLKWLPARLADAVSAPLIRLLVGDITKLGLNKMPYGPFEQIKREGKTPVLDIGLVKHLRGGHIDIYGDINHIHNTTIYFAGDDQKDFEAIVACVGYQNACGEIINVDKSRFEDLKVSVDRQKYFGMDGLYFCGFWIGPTGQIREIASDAKKIAADIARNTIRL